MAPDLMQVQHQTWLRPDLLHEGPPIKATGGHRSERARGDVEAVEQRQPEEVAREGEACDLTPARRGDLLDA